MLPKTLVLIPAFNAGPELDAVLEGVAGYHPRDGILVVDDGSTTTEYADLKAAGWRVERRPHVGKGSALRAGFEIALAEGYDWVITMDADGQHSPHDLPKFLAAIESGAYDLIVGNRMENCANMPFLRKLTNRSSSLLLRLITRVPMHDVQSGYRALSRCVLAEVKLTTFHFDTEIEQLMQAARLGKRFGEAPIATIYNECGSFISKSRDTYRFCRIVLKLRWEHRGEKRYRRQNTDDTAVRRV